MSYARIVCSPTLTTLTLLVFIAGCSGGGLDGFEGLDLDQLPFDGGAAQGGLGDPAGQQPPLDGQTPYPGGQQPFPEGQQPPPEEQQPPPEEQQPPPEEQQPPPEEQDPNETGEEDEEDPLADPDRDGNETQKDEAPFDGAWVTAYGDDRVTNAAAEGKTHYALRLDVHQDGSALSGDGQMFRIARYGEKAPDEAAFEIEGQASGNAAVIEPASASSDAFEFTPRWHLRWADGHLAGMHVETSNENGVVRSGHSLWHRAADRGVEGEYASAYTDAFSGSGETQQSRLGRVSLSENVNGLEGAGTLLEAAPDETVDDVRFRVTRGALQDGMLGMTFGGGGLAPREIDWFAFHTGGVIAGAYGEFDANDALVRAGAADWLPAAPSGTEDFSRTWVASFSDEKTSAEERAADFLGQLRLEVTSGGVSGSARLLDERAEEPGFASYDIADGERVDSRLFLQLQGNSETFFWDLHLGDGAMTGTYERLDANGNLLGQGTAEWMPQTASPDLEGEWVTAYHDTHGAQAPETTQLAEVEVNELNTDEGLTGAASRHPAGKEEDPSLQVEGAVNSDDLIEWVWEDSARTGETLWQLLPSGDRLHGTYTRFDDAGAIESRGSAIWLRSPEPG